jgi:hypothetical protein
MGLQKLENIHSGVLVKEAVYPEGHSFVMLYKFGASM